MTNREYPFVLGTAGHIDHGKTAIVRALSGVDCDRLMEEKKRGMTIELGFAPLDLPSGNTISIIDVPGHEKFIRQMVAGAAGIDAVMLVIAADDGVMPQTREHLEILTLLGIQNGIAVINKIDLVDEEMLELAKDEIYSLTAGTFLEGKPLMPVSALTGKGIPELMSEIDEMVLSAKQRERNGAFFMPVDRAFHISGFGTVLTGTAMKGSVSEGDDVQIMPSGLASKVRSLQVHGENVEAAYAGQRIAINISGTSLDKVKRGDALTAADCYLASDCIDVLVTVLSSFSEPVEHWQRLRLHVGTTDTIARISLLDRERILPGESAPAQLLPEEEITLSHDAHFILRTYSPLRTIAGGRVLLPAGERPKSKKAKTSLTEFLNKITESKNEKDSLAALLDYKGILKGKEALLLLGTDKSRLDGIVSSLEAKGRLATIKTGEMIYISSEKLSFLKAVLGSELKKFHGEHPERKGMEIEEVSKCIMSGDVRFVKELLRIFLRDQWLVLEGDRYRLFEFEPFDEAKFFSEVSKLKELLTAAGYSMPSVEEARSSLGISEKAMTRIITYMRERKDLSIVGEGYLFFSAIEEDLRKKLAEIDGEITLAGVRDITNSSRKYILPLLEYFDSKGVTRRVGDKRLLLKRKD
ncbi:MAG: selenocysteine-specific translation elongation factor [Synergistaceae bacterium]|nr:selenocysteine-specific translation elongation factor [Synergistaceae bacterium]MCK9437064.1 selenocysteine-specific translation elongation factor [Synergistaceae bacterium]MDD2349967.1 selenocysteine-specific translation elongation factor [Synergistaceae bacterium]MDD3319185.1 selenocysteine-specific translation elongation factor [Synergistaceae bacterium]MDD3963888.1 selenocysteine-specific translation elongation factor [Synergistaceae bacterium]